MKKSFTYNFRIASGFTLLYAVLVMSAVLTVVFSILNITLKQLVLSSIGKESQTAFYAADSGWECARYNDNLGVFATATTATITCNGQTTGGVGGDGVDGVGSPIVCPGNALCPPNISGTFAVSDFSFLLNPSSPANSPQVAVTVYKDTSSGESTVESRGRNTNNTASPQRLERAIRLTYTPKPPTTTSLCSTGSDIMFLLDVSGSVSNDINSLINAATSSITNLLAKSNIRLGFVPFGDYPSLVGGLHLATDEGGNYENDLISFVTQIGATQYTESGNSVYNPNANGKYYAYGNSTNMIGALQLAYNEFSGLDGGSNYSENLGNCSSQGQGCLDVTYTSATAPQTPPRVSGNPKKIFLITDGAPHGMEYLNGSWPMSGHGISQYSCTNGDPSSCVNYDLDPADGYSAGQTEELNQAHDAAVALKQLGVSIYVIGVAGGSDWSSCSTPGGFGANCGDFLSKEIAGDSSNLGTMSYSHDTNAASQYYVSVPSWSGVDETVKTLTCGN